MGVSIEVTAPKYPTETIMVVCGVCGSTLALTRYMRTPEGVALLPETEQYCPICGATACQEDEGVKAIIVKNGKRDFFSGFHK